MEPDAGRAVADFHTGFNIILALLFFPLLKPFARLLVRLLPARVDTADPSRPLYLDWAARETPSIALRSRGWITKGANLPHTSRLFAGRFCPLEDRPSN